MNPRSRKQDTEDQKDTFKDKLGIRVFDLKKLAPRHHLIRKGARKDRERARRARALKGETSSAKFLETAFSLKGFIFRDGKTPGSGICRNRSCRPRHKSCLPRRTGLVGLDAQALAGGWGRGVQPTGHEWLGPCYIFTRTGTSDGRLEPRNRRWSAAG